MPVEMRSLGDGVLQSERGDRQHREAALADEEGVFVGAVQRAAVFQDPQAPGGGLLGRPDGRARSRSPRRTPRCRGGSAILRRVRPVTTAVTPRSLSQPKSRRSSERTVAASENAPNRFSSVSSTTRLAFDLIDRRTEPDEERLEIPLAGLVHVDGRDLDVVEDEHSVALRTCGRSKPSEATLAARSAVDSSKARNTPASP